jgi:hypothetical protein
MTSFNLNYFFKGPISKYNHIGVRALMYEFGGDIIQSMTDGWIWMDGDRLIDDR